MLCICGALLVASTVAVRAYVYGFYCMDRETGDCVAIDCGSRACLWLYNPQWDCFPAADKCDALQGNRIDGVQGPGNCVPVVCSCTETGAGWLVTVSANCEE
jgi:hypothetical protein